MKFLPLQTFDEITNALNFDTSDCHVVGGCDLYTTKAAGPDKKLYKAIELGLESQYESLLRLSASLSPPHASSAAETLNLARSSPFGPLSEHSSRRTYAYLIATLNASHPDYDFSHLLRPSDFRREKSLKRVINTIDTTLFNLRPNMARDVSLPAPNVLSSSLSATQNRQHAGAGTGTRISPSATAESPAAGPLPVASSSVPPNAGGGADRLSAPAAATAAGASAAPAATTAYSWGPRMWKLIDEQMTLTECAIYSYNPEEDPYEGDEGEEDGAIWSLKYFFFNKQRKRVCYLYLKGISVLSGSFHEPRIAQGIPIAASAAIPTAAGRRRGGAAGAGGRLRQYGYYDSGFDSSDEEHREKDGEDSVKKKARYWLGEYAAIKMRRNIDSDEDSDFNDDGDEEGDEDVEVADAATARDDGASIRPIVQHPHHPHIATSPPQVVDGDVEMMLDDDDFNEQVLRAARQEARDRRGSLRKNQPLNQGQGQGQAQPQAQTPTPARNDRTRRRSRSPRGSKSSGGVSEQMAGMMEV